MSIQTTTTTDFHGDVWSLTSVYDNDYYMENNTGSGETHCTDKSQECNSISQWNDTLIGASKTSDGSHEKCVCLWKQNAMEKKGGSKYCPSMYQKDGHWVADQYVDPSEDYTWCIQEDGKLCSGQPTAGLPADNPITNTSKCKAYMEKNYPETVYTTFRKTDGVAECKGYTGSPRKLVRAAEKGKWETMKTYKKQPGIATKVQKNNIYKRADGCTSGGQGGVWKRGSTSSGDAHIQPSGWPGSCPSFFDGTRESNLALVAECEYPKGTVPTRAQAQKLVNAAKDDKALDGTAQFLSNYCFRPITAKSRMPSGMVSAPTAMSTNTADKNICKDFKQLYQTEYDTGAEKYCQAVYDRYKDVTGFDFSTTGCQCLIDAVINPNPGLQSVVTTLQTAPSCVWEPCLNTGKQLLPIEGNLQDVNDSGIWQTNCPELPSCSNIVNIGGGTGSQVDQSEFNQQINCNIGSESECHNNNDCNEDQSCNSIGSCVTSCANVNCTSGKVCNPESGFCVPEGSPLLDGSGSSTAAGGGKSNAMLIIIIIVSIIVLGLGGLGIWWWMKP